jgi:hypothetical protein
MFLSFLEVWPISQAVKVMAESPLQLRFHAWLIQSKKMSNPDYPKRRGAGAQFWRLIKRRLRSGWGSLKRHAALCT